MKYRKKPVLIEAVQWDGNWERMSRFVYGREVGDAEFDAGYDDPDFPVLPAWDVDGALSVVTPEGEVHASPGDFIVRGVQGEFYPCKPDIFELSHEVVE